MADELMTVAQTAEYLKISDKTVRRLISDCSLVASRVGSSWRIKKSDIEDYLHKNNNKQEDIV